MSEEGPPRKRVRLTEQELDSLSKDDLLKKWNEQESYIDTLVKQGLHEVNPNEELVGLRESEEKLKQQQIEATRQQNVLIMRLTQKEQEMQEYVNQIQELKQAQSTSTSQLRSMLLDPAVNLMFQRMKKEMEASKEKLEQAQNDLAAWKFTPDSQTGKRLMAKCRMLLQENEELGKVISSGRTAKLEGDIALEKTLVQEMKKSQAEMDEFLVELDEDVEGMQSTIYFLQQQLKETKEQLATLQIENEQLKAKSQGVDQSPMSPVQQHNTDTYVPHIKEEVRTPKREVSSPGYDFCGEVKQDDERTPQQTDPHHDYGDIRQNHGHPAEAGTKNGDHVAMETDASETDGQQESGDDDVGTDNSHPPPETTEKQINNHATRLVDYPLADCAYPTESTGTDASSDAWSPNPSKHSVGMTDDEHDQNVVTGSYKSDSKSGVADETMPNGLVGTPQYEDSQDDDEEDDDDDDEEEEEEDT